MASTYCPASFDEAQEFIFRIIASAPGFKDLNSLDYKEKAFKIIGIMRERGLRPISPEEFVASRTRCLRGEAAAQPPLFVWKVATESSNASESSAYSSPNEPVAEKIDTSIPTVEWNSVEAAKRRKT